MVVLNLFGKFFKNHYVNPLPNMILFGAAGGIYGFLEEHPKHIDTLGRVSDGYVKGTFVGMVAGPIIIGLGAVLACYKTFFLISHNNK